MSNNKFQLGRTLPGETRKNRDLELARLATRKRRKIRKTTLTFILITATLALATWITTSIITMIQDSKKAQTAPILAEPTVHIIDENAGHNISARVKNFAIKIEQDCRDLSLTVDRIVLPLQKAREIDVYLADRTEYYKMSLDRSTSTQAEDTARMIRHLDEKGIAPTYVDLRIEGKAYYK